MAKLFIFLLVTIFVFIQCNVANNKLTSGNYAESVYEPSILERKTVNNGNKQIKAKAKNANLRKSHPKDNKKE
uniref:Uncharacterized protein n=1 Tax=Meloidogyne enterolobii TaxID=390850 RepID=A0A6V7V5D2_MELEN|nr:unnamed protein product [Meloidogyne enterolobii]